MLTRPEVDAVLSRMHGTNGMIARLLYGSGLRLMEAVRLRVKDIESETCEILVRDGKGAKDRVTMLPATLVEPLRAHLVLVREMHIQGPGGRSARRLSAACAGPEVSQRTARVGMAIRVSVRTPFG